MPWEAWFTLAVVLVMVLALVRNWAGPDAVMLAALTVLMTGGLFSDGKLPSPQQAVAGFGNEAVVTIAVLFVVAAGLAQTGAMTLITQPLLGRPGKLGNAQLRLMLPVAGLSAFLNNTPIVAMFMPVVSDWCRKTGISPSKLFIPLSYAAILGGSCTLIGTSTNLLVHGMVLDAQSRGDLTGVTLHMFTIAAVGVPATIVGLVYIVLLSPRLLPDRRAAVDESRADRQYTVEMLVEAGSAIDGKSIEQAGLRHLPGVFLADIERNGERLVAVGPEQVLRGGDRLIFVGVVESVVDLQKIRGLSPASEQIFKLRDPRPNRRLVEAVVSDNCPLVGKTVREGRFRTLYDAAIIAVHRGGEHLNQKIGDIVLRAGDTLLIETHPRFVDRQRNRRDFFLVSTVEDSQPPRHDRAWLALGLLAALIVLVTFTPMRLVNGALVVAGLMVLTRCLTMNDARLAVEWRVLLTFGAAVGVGAALHHSGAAAGMAAALLAVARPMGPTAILAAVYLLALVFNLLIGNVAAAVLVFPVAVAAASGLNFMPFAIAIMMAASSSFATPISYPTNLMVYGAGGYRFGDYVRIGLPLNLIVMAVTLMIAPRIWPLAT